jgi:RNA polymerase sigma factor (sigma-70 family)
MGAKSTINPEVLKIINKTVDEAVKKAAEAIRKANEEADAGQRNYFKETERLLYSLPALRLKVAQDEEDLQNNQIVMKRKSADVIRFSGIGNNSNLYDPEADYIESRKASMERTKREIQRIDRALETIQDDQYYEIIPLKYWDGLKLEEISERMNCDMSTVCRAKNRLVNKLKIVLFGADAL